MARERKASPQPFFLKGGPLGVLLIHGFTGSPAEMALVAHYLHRKGLTVSVPLLPGHGTTPEDLNSRRWEEWVSHARSALRELQARCESVFLGGLSLGSLVALELAQADRGIRGVVLYSPPVLMRARLGLSFHLAKRIVRLVPKARYQEDDLRDPAARARLWDYDKLPLIALGQLMRFATRVRAGPRTRSPALPWLSPAFTTRQSTKARRRSLSTAWARRERGS